MCVNFLIGPVETVSNLVINTVELGKPVLFNNFALFTQKVKNKSQQNFLVPEIFSSNHVIQPLFETIINQAFHHVFKR